jgi:hypothetical protein
MKTLQNWSESVNKSDYCKWILLTSASGALVKKSKSSKFYIEENITFTLKKLATQISRQFYHFKFFN